MFRPQISSLNMAIGCRMFGWHLNTSVTRFGGRFLMINLRDAPNVWSKDSSTRCCVSNSKSMWFLSRRDFWETRENKPCGRLAWLTDAFWGSSGYGKICFTISTCFQAHLAAAPVQTRFIIYLSVLKLGWSNTKLATRIDHWCGSYSRSRRDYSITKEKPKHVSGYVNLQRSKQQHVTLIKSFFSRVASNIPWKEITKVHKGMVNSKKECQDVTENFGCTWGVITLFFFLIIKINLVCLKHTDNCGMEWESK
jgi:hypothetical protein